ncbi:MAG: RNA polymerase Rpb4, partial [Candidatus Thorarchaeota archaeon]|nr:RNA polymerase Rpb4 [Candidatus Thorarchaeota archaeon]
ITLEHASSFSKMAPAVASKLVEKLMKDFNLSRAQAVQIVNISPTNPEEIRTILDARSTDLTDQQVTEIMDLIVDRRSK